MTKSFYYNTLVKGMMLGIPIGIILAILGYSLGMEPRHVLYVAGLYAMLSITDWLKRTEKERENSASLRVRLQEMLPQIREKALAFLKRTSLLPDL